MAWNHPSSILTPWNSSCGFAWEFIQLITGTSEERIDPCLTVLNWADKPSTKRFHTVVGTCCKLKPWWVYKLIICDEVLQYIYVTKGIEKCGVTFLIPKLPILLMCTKDYKDYSNCTLHMGSELCNSSSLNLKSKKLLSPH